ncbi:MULTISPECIES: DUF456 domain-containing protein [unclassified Mycolicibacterium]|uniref:DUF456 domain-containing protein n=1 Tax=unclassified Mycolicibacterium TaxID=2636767 RepID=UPI00130BB06A|nr:MULTISPECIES: DUF456 domain-containing protein [unclassified Mycolicibacterium]MUL82825.1 DUF456 domain-containing protein [Mycolicibacterium sp. CBMA 329]MUL89160.1 DUF456 domain-containing protein [Mycolicibacterium sp. CBMA 331]MUL97727.1 DUF456 domain-containing protein [Mycolicibacterium sp. CBMA 334]MUM29871.1 DUF456 domain-containing protein [Mycolicibacterium sp. CBMA 295]MUM38676.1 DUF456 domain-containing protein [Mycolicibacterium sp. CBMA 247]
MSTLGVVLVALVIAVGLVGIVVPVLPGGGFLVFAAIAVWAIVERTTASWVTLGVAAVFFVTAEVIKYVWPVRRMRAAEVRTWSLVVGGVLGLIGFFVIPVIGLVIGFVVGVYLAELAARHDYRRAWASTVHALKGVALSVGVELTGALLATGTWVTGLVIAS